MSSHPAIAGIAAELAKSDGLDWDEPCAYEANEDADHCGSPKCVAAHYEDHDPDVARSNYLKHARIAFDFSLEEAAKAVESVKHWGLSPTKLEPVERFQQFAAKILRAQKSDSPERAAHDAKIKEPVA